MVRRFILAFAAMFCAGMMFAEEPNNLLNQGEFKPVYMHGMPTAALGWGMTDMPRRLEYRSGYPYLPGEDCFKLEFRDGGMVIHYVNPLPDAYTVHFRKEPVQLRSRILWPTPPAPYYQVSGRVLFEKGKMRLTSGQVLKPMQGWQEFSFASKSPLTGVDHWPENGAKYGFADFKCLAVYPNLGKGTIALPDGGKLTRFLIPRNASYTTRWGIALWRGWFWKLTGIALPIETVDKVVPTPGAFVAIPTDKLEKGDWNLRVNKTGIVLEYKEEYIFSAALMDYLRLKLGCAFYSTDCVKCPANGSVKALFAIDRKARPFYKVLRGDIVWNCMNGATQKEHLSTVNDSNYYHLPNPQDDHVLNVMLPQEHYYKSHPEYYMMDKHGKRVIVETDPMRTQVCFSNQEMENLLIKNSMDYLKGQTLAKYFCFSSGDADTLCQCEKCKAFNKGIDSSSDVEFRFGNKLAREMKKHYPGMQLIRSAYAAHHKPPRTVKEIEDNIFIAYCLTYDYLPCTLHVDCPANKAGIQQIRDWFKAIKGDRRRMGFTTYRDMRPYHVVKQLDFLRQFGCGSLMIFYWKGFSPAVTFVLPRWNLGEDLDKLMTEFDHAYYGKKGGPLVHQVNLMVKDWTENYKHTPEELKGLGTRHLCVWGCELRATSLVPRALYDKIYPLFEKALAEETDPKALLHIAKEYRFYLSEDLLAHNRQTCKNDKELQEFVVRLRRFVTLSQKFLPNARIFYNVDCREMISKCAGYYIPNTGKSWTKELETQRILEGKPEELFKRSAVKIPGGWYFNPMAFNTESLPNIYDYHCVPRMKISLARKTLRKPDAEVQWSLEKKPTAPLFMAVEGLDDDKPGSSMLRIEVNGNKLYEGPCGFPEDAWGRRCFTLPASYLKAGVNTIRFINVTPDLPHRSARFTNQEQAIADGQWGWLMISEMFILDPNGDFQRYLQGKTKDNLWAVGTTDRYMKKKRPTLKVEKGVATMTASEEVEDARIAYFRGHKTPKLVLNPGEAVKITVTLSGEGEAFCAISGYLPYLFDKYKKQILDKSGYLPRFRYVGDWPSPVVTLTAQPKTYTFVLKPRKDVGLYFPRITLKGHEGKLSVHGCRLEIVPAK